MPFRSLPILIFSRADEDPNKSSGGSSPPIVVAFLCVGMFGVGIIAILGWRRQFNRLWYSPVDIPTASAPDLSLRPELWDVWVRQHVPGLLGMYEFKVEHSQLRMKFNDKSCRNPYVAQHLMGKHQTCISRRTPHNCSWLSSLPCLARHRGTSRSNIQLAYAEHHGTGMRDKQNRNCIPSRTKPLSA